MAPKVKKTMKTFPESERKAKAYREILSKRYGKPAVSNPKVKDLLDRSATMDNMSASILRRAAEKECKRLTNRLPTQSPSMKSVPPLAPTNVKKGGMKGADVLKALKKIIGKAESDMHCAGNEGDGSGISFINKHVPIASGLVPVLMGEGFKGTGHIHSRGGLRGKREESIAQLSKGFDERDIKRWFPKAAGVSEAKVNQIRTLLNKQGSIDCYKFSKLTGSSCNYTVGIGIVSEDNCFVGFSESEYIMT